jgi:large subunit ribosomal protein L29
LKEVKGTELRSMQDVELKARYKELKEEQFNLRYQLAIGQGSNLARFKQVRHEIARVLSIANERGISLR